MLPIFFSFFFGRFSDIRGRKATIILSYIILTLGLMSMYFRERPLLLILGIFLLAINRAVIAPTIFALIGDVSTEKNIEAHTDLLWMAQNIGVVSALIFSGEVGTKPLSHLRGVKAQLGGVYWRDQSATIRSCKRRHQHQKDSAIYNRSLPKSAGR